MATPQPARAPRELDDHGRSGEPDDGDETSGTNAKAVPPKSSVPKSLTEDTLSPGTLVAERYRIERVLGEGGMGKVYRAEHIHMRKHVAIKVLHHEMTSAPEVVARFEREAIAAGKISHPNVAAATDFGRLEDGSFFLCLEYVAGKDLRSIIRVGPVPPARALHIVQQIVAAVGAAHAAGVVHRDLKPENIMLVNADGEHDTVKVLDFGIAKLEAIGIVDPSGATHAPDSGSQPLTKMGAVFGTPDYMSPEQALGQPIDARSDLYSIGVMLFELLSGERPFKGGAVTLMRQHVLQEAPPLPAAISESLDPRLGVILRKLLEKSAQDRYASASELSGALVELLTAQPPDVTSSAPSVKSRASFPRMASMSDRLPSAQYDATHSEPPEAPAKKRSGFMLFLLLVGGAGFAVWYTGRSPVDLARSVVAAVTPPVTGDGTTPATPPLASSKTAHTVTSESASSVASSAIVPALPSAAPAATDSASVPAASASAAVASSSSAVAVPVAPSASAAPPVDPPPPASGALAAPPVAPPPDDPSPPVPPQPAAQNNSPPPQHHVPQQHTAPAHTGVRHHGGKRHTGPGGVYIPPPSQWFK